MRRLWRFIAGTRRRRIVFALFVAVVAAIVIALAGAGSSPSTRSYTGTESCTSADVEANVRLSVYSSEGRAACEAVDRTLGKEGSYWRVQPEGSELEGELVCSLGKSGTLIEVRDTGGHFYGNKFCALLTGKGWTEQEGPGKRIEQESPNAKPKRRWRKNNAKRKNTKSRNAKR